MDPTANLEEQRRLASRLRERLSRPEKISSDEAFFLEMDAERLADLVKALDEWIRGGGFLPTDWNPSRRAHVPFTEFWRDLGYTDIRRSSLRLSAGDRRPSLRLYCTTVRTTWNLQIRGPLQLANGRDGRDFILANTYLNRDDLLALHDAIHHALQDPSDG